MPTTARAVPEVRSVARCALVLLGCLVIAACARSHGPQPSPQSTHVTVPSQATDTPVAPPPAAADDIQYRATGTEPFWGLSVTQRELRVTWPEPEPSIATPYTVEERADGRTYKGAALNATVTFKACSDGMSDRVYPHTIKVVVGERTLHGCGWPAGHDLGPAP